MDFASMIVSNTGSQNIIRLIKQVFIYVMKLATWNINSLNVRLPHVLDWLARQQPDVLCLQETKLEDAKFPVEALRQAGYHALSRPEDIQRRRDPHA